jgi:hypothetical protein
VVLRSADRPVVLLNFTLDFYSGLRVKQGGADLRGLVQVVLRSLGVQPAVRVTDTAGKPLPRVKLVRLTRGPALFVGLMRGDFNDVEETEAFAQVHFPDSRHLYDMRQKRYLGQARDPVLPLRTCRAEFLAALPYTVAEVRVQAACTQGLTGRTLACKGTVLGADAMPVPDCHAVTVRVFGPAGVERPHYFRKALTQNGVFEVNLALALNDPAGLWTLAAEDVATGVGKRVFVEAR